MKKRILTLALALVMALGLSVGAAAAGEAGIAVQLNGQNIEFTDAAPISKDNRTFLPARAVFEAMGAELSYDNETRVITAVREGMSVTMTVGSTEATVSVGELVDVALTMDVAPFIGEGDRAYVPVRFAGEAFGCQVGWDQDDQTVILVDTATLISEHMVKHEFTWLEKLAAYETKFSNGKWALDGDITGDVTLNATSVMAIDMGIEGLIDGQKSGQMTMTMTMDMTGLMEMMAALTGTTVEEAGLTEEELKQTVTMEIRMNLETGMIYMLGDDNYCETMGLEKGTWLSMDMSEALQYSMDTLTTFDMLSTAGVVTELNDKDTAYQSVIDGLDKYYAAISDDGFQKVDGGYATTVEMTDETITASITITLETNSRDEVVGYATTISGTADLSALLDAETVEQLAAMGMNLSSISIDMTSSFDSKNKSVVDMTIALGNVAGMELSGEIQYTASTDTAQTEPPADSVVVDYFELLATAAEATPAQPAPAPAA